MSLSFEGSRDLPVTVEVAAARLSDPRFLVACVPDATPVGEPTADEAACVVRPSFAFAKGQLEVRVRIVARDPSAPLRFALWSKGIGATAETETQVTLTPTESGCRATWTASVTKLGGLLKAVPSGLLRAAAVKTIDEVWARVQTRIAE